MTRSKPDAQGGRSHEWFVFRAYSFERREQCRAWAIAEFAKQTRIALRQERAFAEQTYEPPQAVRRVCSSVG